MGLDAPQVFLPELWQTHGKYFPNKEAIVCGQTRLTWGQFTSKIRRISDQLLVNCQVKKGEKIAVVMNNSAEMMCVMCGIQTSGGCLVPLSLLLSSEQMNMMLDDSDSVIVISSSMGKTLIDRSKLPKVRMFISYGFDENGWVNYDKWLEFPLPKTIPRVEYSLEDEYNIIYSSGTTGKPKGIVLTHRARQHWCFSNALEMRYNNTTKGLTTTALYSNGTLLVALPTLFVGGTLHILETFDPKIFLETVEKEKITHTFMVPTQLIVTLSHHDFDRYNLTSLQCVLSAGSILRDVTKEEVLRRMCKGLYELYGLTEGTSTMVKPEQHSTKFGSVGTPVIGFDVAIIDDNGKLIPPGGEAGEIIGYGAGMMKKYHKRDDLTKDITWRDEKGRTWIRTGDVGQMDSDGFLYIRDRKKDMIVSGGFNVFPTDIEEKLSQHPAVLDCTVIGIPHPKWGETPLGLVIKKEGAKATESEILETVNPTLSKTQRLFAIEFKKEFPRNALGKVLKKDLREPYWKDQKSKI